jgi:hypothetical protein
LSQSFHALLHNISALPTLQVFRKITYTSLD